MYTGSAWKYVNRYKYNAFKVLTTNPSNHSYVAYSPYRNTVTTGIIDTNFNNFLSKLSGQLTTRQVTAINEVRSLVKSGGWNNRFGIHEFRFEGAGCYRSGIDDNSYNLNDSITHDGNPVSTVSVDFTSLNGNHNSLAVSGFFDGFGVYGAMSVVYRDCEIMGVFFRASTLPDQMELDDTVADGNYYFKVGTHTGYPALNLYSDSNCSNRYLPTAIDHVSPSTTASYINSHRGYTYYRGSEGCQTIRYNASSTIDNDYQDYINLFTNGETGRFIIKRYVTLPNV